MLNFSNLPSWLDYEDYVYDTLRSKYPNHRFERDIRPVGKTGTKRQVDIAIFEQIAGHEIFVVVDCKHYEKKIDVKNVETFIGMLEDLGADIGIMVTANGYTDTAMSRAKMSRVRLDIVEYEDIDEYKFDIDICDECFPGDDRIPGIVDWGKQGFVEGDIDKVGDVGRCDHCLSLHIRCKKCGNITPIPEAAYEEEIECLGGCGFYFHVQSVYLGSGETEDILTVKEIDE